jgi:hypothetical protein
VVRDGRLDALDLPVHVRLQEHPSVARVARVEQLEPEVVDALQVLARPRPEAVMPVIRRGLERLLEGDDSHVVGHLVVDVPAALGEPEEALAAQMLLVEAR